MASDGHTKVICPDCLTRLRVDYLGDVVVLGPKDKPISNAEDLNMTEDRLCSRCRYFRSKWKRIVQFYLVWIGGLLGFYFYGWQAAWFGGYWKIIGGILCLLMLAGVALVTHVLNYDLLVAGKCTNRDARSAAGTGDPELINPNLRCRFWAARKS